MWLLLWTTVLWLSAGSGLCAWPRPSSDAAATAERLSRLEMKVDRILEKLSSVLNAPSMDHWMSKIEGQINEVRQSVPWTKLTETMDLLRRYVQHKEQHQQQQQKQDQFEDSLPGIMSDMATQEQSLPQTEKMTELLDKLNEIKKQVDESRTRIMRRLGRIEQKVDTKGRKEERHTKTDQLQRDSPFMLSADKSSCSQESINRQIESVFGQHCKDIGVKLGDLTYLADHRLIYAINGIHKDVRQGVQLAKDTQDSLRTLSGDCKIRVGDPEQMMPPISREKAKRMDGQEEPIDMASDGSVGGHNPPQMMTKRTNPRMDKKMEPEAVAEIDPSHPRSCAQILKQSNGKSGVYSIWPKAPGKPAVRVHAYCDMDIDGGGWTVFQRRGSFGGSQENFTRPWTEYKKGFGKANRDFWLGNDALHALTTQEQVRLRVELEAWNDDKGVAEYSLFQVTDEEDLYRIAVGGYVGNVEDGLSYHNGSAFSTVDRNHADHLSRQCHTGEGQGGGWWYKNCYYSKLNSPYYPQGNVGRSQGIVWRVWKGFMYSLRGTEMKLRPLCFPDAQHCNQDNDMEMPKAMH